MREKHSSQLKTLSTITPKNQGCSSATDDIFENKVKTEDSKSIPDTDGSRIEETRNGEQVYIQTSLSATSHSKKFEIIKAEI